MRTRTKFVYGGVTTRSMTRKIRLLKGTGKKQQFVKENVARRKAIRKMKDIKKKTVVAAVSTKKKMPKQPRASKSAVAVPAPPAPPAISFAPAPPVFLSPSTEPIRLLESHDADFMRLKTVAIIVSIHPSSSYDNHFTSNRQKSAAGTKTMVFEVTGNNYIDLLLEGIDGKPTNPTVKQLFEEMSKLDPDCTVFNWECSSGYSGKSFPEGDSKVMRLVDGLLKRRHMVMFSDFSLKALIAKWDDKLLGPNPFK